MRMLLVAMFASLAACGSSPSIGNAPGWELAGSDPGDGFLVTAPDGRQLKVKPYGASIIRLQSRGPGEDFLPDDHYDIVIRHDWHADIDVEQHGEHIVFTSDRLEVRVDAETLAAQFFLEGRQVPVLEELSAVTRDGTDITASFVADDAERFTGLGHGYLGRTNSIDLRGQVVRRNYGREHTEQAPLIVPFFLSSKGYGLFLNSMFPNTFRFAADGVYEVSIDDHGFGGQMDYFFIAGPDLTDVLRAYVRLTGQPRLPAKSMFGLQLSDKGHDHNSATPSDLAWWKEQIAKHREAGFPLDHIVNDNRWRAGGGKRCESRLEWDPERYPDPAGYKKWLDAAGLVTTLDFNRCIAQFSDGWSADYNLPQTDNIAFADSAPDLTNEEFRRWFWQIFYEQSLDPDLGFPGEALWIDEFDEMGAAPAGMILANGRSWAEMRNYWFFLIAKALVDEGHDRSDIERRPFVWVRGMTAGAQRYATLWSGDIRPDYDDMRAQIRSMQLAGLSGFPYWSHDAGGFYDYERQTGPDDEMYLKWSMAYGSFAPIWRPHGMGQSRWPADRPADVQAAALRYARLRYELMPYTYTAAHEAAGSGLPIARPMLLQYPDDAKAWEFDLQYMWGDDLLVAPNSNDRGEIDVWLPDGTWYELGTGIPVVGSRIVTVAARPADMPVYVRAGAIIPRREFALSTAFIDKSRLIIDVYAGADGSYTLVEDDDRTEAYRRQDARMTTTIEYNDEQGRLMIHAATGSYEGAPGSRSYAVRFTGSRPVRSAIVNGVPARLRQDRQRVVIEIPETGIRQSVTVDLVFRQ